MDISDLLEVALENLRVGETEEAVHSLRSLADEVELVGCPSYDDLVLIVGNFMEVLDEG